MITFVIMWTCLKCRWLLLHWLIRAFHREIWSKSFWQILPVESYTVWVKKKFTPRKIANYFKNHLWTVNYYTSYEECFIPNHLLSFLCGMCSCLDEQEALFARIQHSTWSSILSQNPREWYIKLSEITENL